MLTFAFPTARRRQRLALAGALFLAVDALLMGVAIAWITRGEHLGLAVALAGAGAVVSILLAWVLSRPPRATLDHGTLRVEAAHRAFLLDRHALQAATIEAIDLTTAGRDTLPVALRRASFWRTDDALGWHRDAAGRPMFCAVTRLGPALRIDAGAEGVLLWTPTDPAAAQRAIAGATD